MGILEAIGSQEWHVFWPDALPIERAHLAGVIGHREITDADLIALARHNDARLVTLDRGRAALHPKQVRLLG